MSESWLEEKKQAVARARRIVFKVGSAVLTDENGVSETVVKSLASQIARAAVAPDGSRRSVVLVTSAAVAAGRSALSRAGVDADTRGLSAKQAAAAVGQGRILRAWDDAFAEQGLTTAQILLTRDDIRASRRLLNITNTLSELLSWGIVPVVNENDTVSTAELKFGDNDSLGSLLVTLVGADLFVNITSARGVFSAPLSDPSSHLLDWIPDVFALNLDAMCGGKTTVGTGGMYSKLLAARRVAQRGVPTCIIPGREEDVITRVLSGEVLGTWISPSEKIPARKFWMAYKSAPAGELVIDDGACNAIENKGASLLPGGVVSVEGAIQKGALVRVVHAGRSLGVGLSNYSAADLRRIRGRTRIEVAAILGDAHYPEVIHRDNLLLDAAI